MTAHAAFSAFRVSRETYTSAQSVEEVVAALAGEQSARDVIIEHCVLVSDTAQPGHVAVRCSCGDSMVCLLTDLSEQVSRHFDAQNPHRSKTPEPVIVDRFETGVCTCILINPFRPCDVMELHNRIPDPRCPSHEGA